jgi:hypothetical protein
VELIENVPIGLIGCFVIVSKIHAVDRGNGFPDEQPRA